MEGMLIVKFTDLSGCCQSVPINKLLHDEVDIEVLGKLEFVNDQSCFVVFTLFNMLLCEVFVEIVVNARREHHLGHKIEDDITSDVLQL